MIFWKIVMSPSVSLAQRTIKPCSIASQRQFFANEADNFLPQCVAGTRPCFRAAEMLHTKLQRRKAKVVGAGCDQGVDALFQQTKKCKLVASTGTISNLQQRDGNRRRCGRKVPTNLLVTNRL